MSLKITSLAFSGVSTLSSDLFNLVKKKVYIPIFIAQNVSIKYIVTK